MSPTPIRPERPKRRRKLFCYFTDTCSECGCLHFYRKYAGWNDKSDHVPLCYPGRHEQFELDL